MANEHSYDSWGSASERFADGSICIGIDLGTTNSCTYRRLPLYSSHSGCGV